MLTRSLWLALLGTCVSTSALAIGTAFSYQGTLEDAAQPANGSYDFQFRVLTAASVQVGPVLVSQDVLVAGGVFTVQLDFGNNVFSGTDRLLEIGVRQGSSTGAFTVLTPSTPLHPAPYAQLASNAELADLALQASDVTDGAIDEIDIASSAISARTIASGAVESSEIAADAVGSSEISAGAVGSSELASLSVGTAELADDAVTGAKVANNTLSLANMQGANGSYNLTATIAANDCADFDLTFGGDIQAGDFPIIAIQAGEQLPDSMSIEALRVISDNLIELRICNELGVAQSFSSLGVKLITLR